MPAEFKDYYKVLGVPPKATPEEIKKAFRTLARKYHPDVAKDKKAAEEKFKELNEAHEVLSDPESRKKYDELGANWKTGGASYPPPPRSGRPAPGGESADFQFEGTGFSDFFEQFFGGRAGRSPFDPQGATGADASHPRAQKGQDINGDIMITLEEALKGVTHTISVRAANPRTGGEETQSFQVRIPPGVKDGQSIRVAGKGGEGFGGGRAGDIYLRVRYAQHPDLRARGEDLVCDLELAPWEAVLGATVPVQTLEGSISLKIPAGAQSGLQLRVRGKGLPAGAGKRGDLYAEISIKVPAQISEEEKELWKQLAAKTKFNPRES